MRGYTKLGDRQPGQLFLATTTARQTLSDNLAIATQKMNQQITNQLNTFQDLVKALLSSSVDGKVR